MKTWSAFVVSAALLAGACDKGDKGKGGGGTPAVAQKDGADGLKDLFVASHAACTGKDFAKGKAIVMGMLPTPAQLKKVFKDDVPAAKLDEVVRPVQGDPAERREGRVHLLPGRRTYGDPRSRIVRSGSRRVQGGHSGIRRSSRAARRS